MSGELTQTEINKVYELLAPYGVTKSGDTAEDFHNDVKKGLSAVTQMMNHDNDEPINFTGDYTKEFGQAVSKAAEEQLAKTNKYFPSFVAGKVKGNKYAPDSYKKFEDNDALVGNIQNVLTQVPKVVAILDKAVDANWAIAPVASQPEVKNDQSDITYGPHMSGASGQDFVFPYVDGVAPAPGEAPQTNTNSSDETAQQPEENEQAPVESARLTEEQIAANIVDEALTEFRPLLLEKGIDKEKLATPGALDDGVFDKQSQTALQQTLVVLRSAAGLDIPARGDGDALWKYTPEVGEEIKSKLEDPKMWERLGLGEFTKDKREQIEALVYSLNTLHNSKDKKNQLSMVQLAGVPDNLMGLTSQEGSLQALGMIFAALQSFFPGFAESLAPMINDYLRNVSGGSLSLSDVMPDGEMGEKLNGLMKAVGLDGGGATQNTLPKDLAEHYIKARFKHDETGEMMRDENGAPIPNDFAVMKQILNESVSLVFRDANPEARAAYIKAMDDSWQEAEEHLKKYGITDESIELAGFVFAKNATNKALEVKQEHGILVRNDDTPAMPADDVLPSAEAAQAMAAAAPMPEMQAQQVNVQFDAASPIEEPKTYIPAYGLRGWRYIETPESNAEPGSYDALKEQYYQQKDIQTMEYKVRAAPQIARGDGGEVVIFYLDKDTENRFHQLQDKVQSYEVALQKHKDHRATLHQRIHKLGQDLDEEKALLKEHQDYLLTEDGQEYLKHEPEDSIAKEMRYKKLIAEKQAEIDAYRSDLQDTEKDIARLEASFENGDIARLKATMNSLEGRHVRHTGDVRLEVERFQEFKLGLDARLAEGEINKFEYQRMIAEHERQGRELYPELSKIMDQHRFRDGAGRGIYTEIAGIAELCAYINDSKNAGYFGENDLASREERRDARHDREDMEDFQEEAEELMEDLADFERTRLSLQQAFEESGDERAWRRGTKRLQKDALEIKEDQRELEEEYAQALNEGNRYQTQMKEILDNVESVTRSPLQDFEMNPAQAPNPSDAPAP